VSVNGVRYGMVKPAGVETDGGVFPVATCWNPLFRAGPPLTLTPK
jgi:hypothetical protein